MNPGTLSIKTSAGDTDHHARNREAWERLLADPVYRALPHRVESNRYGQALLSPPPAPEHGEEQSHLALLLSQQGPPSGRVSTVCPISTSEGVRATDVAWISLERRKRSVGEPFLIEAPEICVEVLSPSNREDEMALKKALYFEAGTLEVWFRQLDGTMVFFRGDSPNNATQSSKLCPDFPKVVRVG